MSDTATSASSGLGGSGSSSSSGAGGGGPSTKILVHAVHYVNGATPIPSPNVLLFSSDAEGKVAETATTNASGDVEITVPFEGTISVAEQVSSAPVVRFITTYADLGEPHEITLRTTAPPGVELPPNTPMPNVHVVTANQPAAAKDIVVSATGLYPSITVPATLPATTIDLPNFKGSPGDGTYDLVLRVRDASGETIAGGKILDAAFTPGVSATNLVALDASLTTATLDLYGVPASTTGYNVQLDAKSDYAGLSAWLNDSLFKTQLASNTSFGAVIPYPSGAYDRLTWSVSVSMPESVVQLVRLAPEGTSADLSVDVGGLPRATASEDLADPEHPVWKWTELGPAPTYVRLEHTWYGSGGNDVPRTFWTAFCRPTGGAGGARFPDLPPEIASWPDVGADATVFGHAALWSLDDLTSYDAFLQTPFTTTSGYTVSNALPPSDD